MSKSVFPWSATTDLAEMIAQALPGAHVTTEAETATPAVLSGRCAVILSAPTISVTVPNAAYTWRLAVVGAPVADLTTAGLALDSTLSAITSLSHVELGGAEPITWTGSQTSQAPAYLLTITVRYPMH